MITKPREAKNWEIRLGFLFHEVSNPLVRLLLHSPLHSLLSEKLILITYTGRKSGLRHTLPVMYANCDGELVVMVGYYWSKKWWLNLRNGLVPVDVRYRGQLLEGSAIAVQGDADVIAPRLAEYCKKFHASARRRGIDPGSPIDPEALKAMSKDEVMVVVRLAPRKPSVRYPTST